MGQSFYHSVVKMIKQCALVFALLVVLAQGQRRGGRSQAPRRGRQEAAGAYSAPEEVPVYGASDAVPTYEAAGDDALAALGNSIPGVPGEDYPIYAEVPESGFTCDGQVDGGYYADPEAECQAFHICTADGAGGLAQYSFLCPNGTLFNQNYFICDWWFNFDCAEAEGLYSVNDDLAAEREAIAAASDPIGSYSSPDNAPIGGYDAPGDVISDAQAAYGQAARNARNGRGPQQGLRTKTTGGRRRQG